MQARQRGHPDHQYAHNSNSLWPRCHDTLQLDKSHGSPFDQSFHDAGIGISKALLHCFGSLGLATWQLIPRTLGVAGRCAEFVFSGSDKGSARTALPVDSVQPLIPVLVARVPFPSCRIRATMAKNIVIAEHRFAALYHLSTLADNPSLWFFTLRLVSGIQVQFRLNPSIFYCILLVGYRNYWPTTNSWASNLWSFWTRLERLDVPGCIISRSQFPSASQAMLPPDVFSSWRHSWSNESTNTAPHNIHENQTGKNTCLQP